MANITYIPTGTKNLRAAFPSIDWNSVEEFYLEASNAAGDIMATTTRQVVDACGNVDDNFRIHFLNYTGTIDAITFKNTSVTHEPKSETYEKAEQFPLVKAAHAISRTAVSSNDRCTGQILVDERNIGYYDELLDSPLAWLEWFGEQGQADDYLPIVLTSTKSPKFKQDDRFVYEINIEFIMSHEFLAIRN